MRLMIDMLDPKEAETIDAAHWHRGWRVRADARMRPDAGKFENRARDSSSSSAFR
ncbi:MAG TPA: hypothetical protein VFP68_07295 [Burkholderiaceae bacterium]|nr:hypothetical protein [Burkholderiaceae bacterium]